jgi:hypothetical protein
MKHTSTALRLCAASAGLATVVAASAETTVTAVYTTPTGDRWNYPFNPTPGLRPTASTFGNEAGSPLFDNRDGQLVVKFNTGNEIPPGRSPASYIVFSARLTVQFATDLAIAYDVTTDPWQSFLLPSDPNYVEDRDPGQPIEVFGVGFRNGWTPQTWVETTPYAPPGSSLLAPGIRNAYALGFDDKGNFVDVSNSVRDQFSPTPFATGFVPDLQPGDLVPIDSLCIFDLATDNPLVQGYLQQSMADGTLLLNVTSLAKVVQQGSIFPSFYTKENPLVQAGFAQAAKLELTVLLFDCEPADLDCDGKVGNVDLALLLGAWGSVNPAFDLDGSGSVGAGDLAILLGAWG